MYTIYLSYLIMYCVNCYSFLSLTHTHTLFYTQSWAWPMSIHFSDILRSFHSISCRTLLGMGFRRSRLFYIIIWTLACNQVIKKNTNNTHLDLHSWVFSNYLTYRQKTLSLTHSRTHISHRCCSPTLSSIFLLLLLLQHLSMIRITIMTN